MILQKHVMRQRAVREGRREGLNLDAESMDVKAGHCVVRFDTGRGETLGYDPFRHRRRPFKPRRADLERAFAAYETART